MKIGRWTSNFLVGDALILLRLGALSKRAGEIVADALARSLPSPDPRSDSPARLPAS